MLLASRRGDLLPSAHRGERRRDAKAQEQAAESAQAQATIEVERARALFASGTIPKAELDRAESGLAAARAAREGAVGVRLARADQHALARAGLEDARLLSPIDGVLARRFVDVGETVSPSAPSR
jgi:membrane fusion protein (multidrug efflux system)